MISLRAETDNLVETVVLQHFMVFLVIPLQPSLSLLGVNCLPFSVSHGENGPYHLPLANSPPHSS